MQESGATQYLRKNGWLKLYRQDKSFAASARERALADTFGIAHQRARRRRRARARTVAGAGVSPRGALARRGERNQSAGGDARLCAALCRHSAACRSAVTRARYIAPTDIGGSTPTAGHLDARDVIVALGPWAPDMLAPLGIKLPLGIKRGYHRHFRSQGQCRARAPGARRRRRLRAGADGAGHSPDHRRRVRRARCAADTGAVRRASCRRRRNCSRSANRSKRCRGWGAGPALPIHVRSSAVRPGGRVCGSPTVMAIGA